MRSAPCCPRDREEPGTPPGVGPGLSGRGSLRSSQSACLVFALLAPFCRLELCGSSVAPLRRVGCSSALRIWISVQTMWICADLRGFAWTHAFLSRWGTKAKCSGQAATETQYSRTDRFCMHLRLRGAKCFVNMFWARFTSRGSISAAHL